ncbi:hypothetical protein [Lysobacter enzymogenes]|uniref:hypothetical protein n=1 Tax=Lysobacter enzymogenes TaxID=69 RepID=UPI001A966F7D|nr:hypothetical protein [Lysobacter enzymogenes]QQP96610.1 hypothetical protein JHW38_00695 [Lysobacter enzymogenes]
MNLIADGFWLLCLGLVYYNFRVGMRRLAATAGPQLEEGQRYMRIFAVAATVPWVVMGWGVVFGSVPRGMFAYFRPQDLNPYVLAWLGSVFALFVLLALWVLLADGARKIQQFGLLSPFGARGGGQTMSLGSIKFLAYASPLFLPVWCLLAASMDA